MNNKRIAVGSGFFLWGVASGVVRMILGSQWLILQHKMSAPHSWLWGLVFVSSRCGGAFAYQIAGNEDAPVPFWIGQLGFYGALFYAICRCRLRRAKPGRTAEDGKTGSYKKGV